jgi:hypothetical protein
MQTDKPFRDYMRFVCEWYTIYIELSGEGELLRAVVLTQLHPQGLRSHSCTSFDIKRYLAQDDIEDHTFLRAWENASE